MNFMTGYIDPATKDVVLDPKKIARRYASSWLLLDVVSSIPTEVWCVVVCGGFHRVHSLDGEWLYGVSLLTLSLAVPNRLDMLCCILQIIAVMRGGNVSSSNRLKIMKGMKLCRLVRTCCVKVVYFCRC